MEREEGGEGRRRRLGRSAAAARVRTRSGSAVRRADAGGGRAPRRLSPFSFRWRKLCALPFGRLYSPPSPPSVSEGGQGRWRFLGLCRTKSLLQGGGDSEQLLVRRVSLIVGSKKSASSLKHTYTPWEGQRAGRGVVRDWGTRCARFPHHPELANSGLASLAVPLSSRQPRRCPST